MTNYVDLGAEISPDERYRYRLWREWRGTHDPSNWRWITKDGNGDPMGEPKSVLFVMLNPSTADGLTDDPTIRRCVKFAQTWKYERLEVVNLFAFRATDPLELYARSDDVIGIDNQECIEECVLRAGLIVCAWGNHGDYLNQHETVLGWIERKTYALGKTLSGMPVHPLARGKNFVPYDRPLIEFSRP